jgi:predicted nucleic acid-binding protein
MKPLLLDTNVLIKFFRSDIRIASIISAYEKIVLPTVVIGEYMAGVDPKTTGGQWQLEVLAAFLDSSAVKTFPVTEDVAFLYARLFRTLRVNGTPIPQNDMWIAACAMESGSTLLSLDRHFENIPLIDVRIVET